MIAFRKWIPTKVSRFNFVLVGYMGCCSLFGTISKCNKKVLLVDLLQPHFEASVKMKLTLPKVGTWSPLGLPQLQSSIAEVKTPYLEMFFIPVKRP
jgi:hypothetical protein